METKVPQKEETFQVVIDPIKNSSCFKAFTISADVPKIFMQQLRYSIKKVQGTDSYEFILANKKCVVNADVFRTILDIYPRVEGANFIDVPDDDTTLAFLIKLRYKGPLLITGRRRDQDEKICHFPDSPRLKLVRIGEDYQKYGLPIPKTMLTEAIKQYESYQMFIKYSTGQIPPKKSRGKGSQRKKTTDDSQETIDISGESIPEPEQLSERLLELGKSISKTKAEEAEAEATRQVHATHARIVTESVLEPTKRIKLSKVTSNPPKKLKGVPNESTIVSATSSKGTGTKPGVPDEENDITKENVILEWGSEQESEYSEEDKLNDKEKDDKEGVVNDEDGETKSDEDDIYKYKIRVRKDEDKEMLNAEVENYDKGDEEVTVLSKGLDLKNFKYLIKDTTNSRDQPTMEVRSVISSTYIQSLSMAVSSEKQRFENLLFKSIEKEALKEYDQKSALYQTMHANKSFNRNPANHRLYHVLMEALIEDENTMDKGVDDTVQDHKRKHDDDEDDDDEDPPAGPNQGKKTKRRRTKESESSKKPSTAKETPKGKAPSKGSKTGKSALAKEPVEEPVAEVVLDDAGDDVVHDDD
ncbi:hypothetical protein Tco_0748569 [Tanacetum coccineum]|uniref:BTB domain-containing protein n=1 Tax=Tanacetum coccineum TaxID=301880 RepID=A0ABQ4YZF1_9ASTR